MKKITFLSSFFIKVFAILFMTMDHIGMFLTMEFSNNAELMTLASVFRIFGRLALPLFTFMIVEGVLHTKNFNKYMLRLGIMASLISLVFITLEYIKPMPAFSIMYRAGNIFLDLTLLAVAIYFIKHKNKYLRLITLLPLAFSALSFIVKGIEKAQSIDIHWFPYFLTMQYDWLTIVLGLAFYFSYLLADQYIKYLQPVSGQDKEMWVTNGNYRFLVNLIAVLLGSIVHIFYYLMVYMWPEGVFWDAGSQAYALITGAFILLYSGKRGYNAKWFQYGSYLYYPLHIAVLAIIAVIISGGL